MAENGRDISEQPKTTVDKELRLRNLKERQNEERHKKLEEIKAQALAAQRYKEHQEQERRRRLDDLRIKEDARRAQVEERKKAINEAERDRLESILRRNHEREARIEAKRRNEKSNIVFAFGSSTPRMLDPIDPTVTFWGQRRATSTQNIPMVSSSLTRRTSERDLDFGNKKRATSAGGLERSGESSGPTTPAGCASGYTGRRRTDLTPTVIQRGDASFTSSRKSLNQSPASSRPSSSMSQQSTTSIASSVNVRHRPNVVRKPRPASIAVTGVSQDSRNSLNDKDNKPPIPRQRKSITKPPPESSKTPSKAKAKSPVDGTPKSLTAANLVNSKVKKDPGDNKTQPKPPDTANEAKNQPQVIDDNPPVIQQTTEPNDTIKEYNVVSDTPTTNNHQAEKNDPEKPVTETIVENVEVVSDQTTNQIEKEPTPEVATFIKEEIEEIVKENSPQMKEIVKENSPIAKENSPPAEMTNSTYNLDSSMNNEMTTSMTKSRITTEEEAKAALAERRRLAREEAERQAEQERLRIEAEAQAELERQQREEEQVRQLIEEQKVQEEKRLQEAIREVQKREEEERLKREEEERMKVLKEEAEKRAREEAERLKAELAERLKNEEKEREKRRKRVEAIMSRTRGKTNSNSQQNSEDKNENKSENNQMNGMKPSDENGTKNGKDVEIVDNIIPDESMKNANNVTLDPLNSSDSLNSNNSWQATQQYDSLM